MSVIRKLAGIGLASSLLFAGTACGGGDKVSEKIAEKAIEDSGGGDVDIDSKDGSVKYTDDDGNKIEYGSGATLPKGWPDDLKPPKSIKIVSSSSSTQAGEKILFVTAESDDDFTDLYEGLKAQLEDGGYEITSDSNIDSGGAGYAGLEAASKKAKVSVSLAEGAEGGKTTILFSVTPLS